MEKTDAAPPLFSVGTSRQAYDETTAHRHAGPRIPPPCAKLRVGSSLQTSLMAARVSSATQAHQAPFSLSKLRAGGRPEVYSQTKLSRLGRIRARPRALTRTAIQATALTTSISVPSLYSSTATTRPAEGLRSTFPARCSAIALSCSIGTTGKSRCLKSLAEISSLGIDGDSFFGHERVHRLPWRGDGHYAFDYLGIPARTQPGRHQGELRARRGIGVTAGTSEDDAVRSGSDVDVEVEIDLGGAENHRVELVHDRPSIMGIGIHRGRHRLVCLVPPIRVDSLEIETLHIEERSEKPGFKHVHDVAGDSARREAALARSAVA